MLQNFNLYILNYIKSRLLLYVKLYTNDPVYLITFRQLTYILVFSISGFLDIKAICNDLKCSHEILVNISCFLKKMNFSIVLLIHSYTISLFCQTINESLFYLTLYILTWLIDRMIVERSDIEIGSNPSEVFEQKRKDVFFEIRIFGIRK